MKRMDHITFEDATLKKLFVDIVETCFYDKNFSKVRWVRWGLKWRSYCRKGAWIEKKT